MFLIFIKFLPKRTRPFLYKLISKLDGGVYYSVLIRKVFKEIHGVTIGYGSYGSCFNINAFPTGTIIGNYCSFGSNIKAFNANHPLMFFTSHPIIYNPRCNSEIKNDLLIRSNLVIGNDVWIGDGVKIMPNVTYIGNGAVVGAGSIVTKNIEPYTVCAGNPCKFIKNRFTSKEIKKIEDSRWWELKKAELKKTELYKDAINHFKGQND